jgi:hypothetical protein
MNSKNSPYLFWLVILFTKPISKLFFFPVDFYGIFKDLVSVCVVILLFGSLYWIIKYVLTFKSSLSESQKNRITYYSLAISIFLAFNTLMLLYFFERSNDLNGSTMFYAYLVVINILILFTLKYQRMIPSK